VEAAVCQSNAPTTAPASVEKLTVDLRTVLNTTRHRPLGINLDYLMDDDRNKLLSPKRPLREGLRELGVKFLRYPGGWKSAINLWSSAPYTASRPALAGRVPDKWIRPGVQLTTSEGTWRLDPLDFDEFIRVCREVRAEPCVVVPYESCYWESKGEWKPPSRELLLETAAAWVRYANGKKNYKVKYWEVGNESWLNNETWTNRIAPETYAADLVEFAKRMKAEDPTILVGANGDSAKWWQVVLSRAAEQIDFLSVHTYPCWKWSSYDDYRKNSLDALGMVRMATTAIAQHAPAHPQRLRIMLTEFAAGTFGDWDKVPADLGRALITFDLQGQLLQCPDVYFSQFWNTHNIYSEVDGGVFDALKRDNKLSPVGRALAIWGQFLGDEMLGTTSSADVRCFAGRKGKQMTVYLVNKATLAREVALTFKGMGSRSLHGAKWVFRGVGPSDPNPTWGRAGSVRGENCKISSRLAPVSITVVAFTAD
jgi:hypothetical protein